MGQRQIPFQFLVSLLSGIALTSSTGAQMPEASSIIDGATMYGVYEKAFTCTNCSSLTNDEKSSRIFNAAFRSGSTTIKLPGFWAGGNIWRFRFTPTLIGLWTWNVDSELTLSETLSGSVNATPPLPGARGFLKKDPNKPYTLCYSDGTPEYLWGNTGYAILDTALHGDTRGWQTFVNQTKDHGMTKIRLLVTLWAFGETYKGEHWYPWENCTKTAPRFAAFNQSYWEKLDEVVRYMHERGVIAELILFPDYSKWPNDLGMYYMTQADEQRYMKFAIARYAAYCNVVWCLTNEWGNSWRGRFPEVTAPPGDNEYTGNCAWHPEWISGGGIAEEYGLGPYMRDNDPYVATSERLLSSHPKGTKPVDGKPGPDYVFNFWHDTWPTHGVIQIGGPNYDPSRSKGHDWGNHGILENWGNKKPIFNDEYGYDDGKNVPRELARKAAWGIAVAGGYGTYAEWHKIKKPKVQGSMAGLWRSYSSQEDIKILINFMKGTDYGNMSQHNNLLDKPPKASAYLYANPGSEYVMYAADAGWKEGFTITLKAGTYDAWWYSTTTGRVIKTEPSFQLATDTPKTFTAPDFSTDTDVLLKIKSSTSVGVSSATNP
jgi:hypothetical protein